MHPLLTSLLISLALAILWTLLQLHHGRRKVAQDGGLEPKNSNLKASVEDPYQAIEPLPSFDWKTTPPLKIRPFKPKYHLTMALGNCPLSELVENDSTYLDRIRHRKELMDAHPRETYRCNDVCEDAVLELYEWIVGTYLPKRFPTMYQIARTEKDGECSHNIPADRYIPLRAGSGTEALYTLGENVDTEMLLLLPHPTSTTAEGSPIYTLQAFVTCFPSGFATQDKLGLTLAGIHQPVPGYAAKLEKSMDRFFAKLECGRALRRANWSITTNDLLYSQGGNHMYEDGSTDASGGKEKTLDTGAANLDDVISAQKRDVEIGKCRLRCERQTLHRLPKTKALVFMFKTYQYSLSDVKAEGSGPELADAIEGLATGNVPRMAYYKRQPVWGDKVVDYLRS